MNIGIEKKVDIDVFRQRIPQIIYKTWEMRQLPYNFLYKFEQGYDFWLDGFYYTHPAIIPPNGSTTTSLQMNVEFIRNIRSRPLQNNPYPCRLVSTPGANGTFPEITAGHKLDYIRYNEPYVFSEVLHARFAWDVIPHEEIKAEVMMFGYLMPENSLAMWE